MNDEVREVVAAAQHEIWAHWMRYLFEQCIRVEAAVIPKGMLIPAHLVERWQRQVETLYSELSEEEKQSDRDQADKVLAAILSAGYRIEQEIY